MSRLGLTGLAWVSCLFVFSLTKAGTVIICEDRAESHGQDWKEGCPIEVLDRQKSDPPEEISVLCFTHCSKDTDPDQLEIMLSLCLNSECWNSGSVLCDRGKLFNLLAFLFLYRDGMRIEEDKKFIHMKLSVLLFLLSRINQKFEEISNVKYVYFPQSNFILTWTSFPGWGVS